MKIKDQKDLETIKKYFKTENIFTEKEMGFHTGKVNNNLFVVCGRANGELQAELYHTEKEMRESSNPFDIITISD